MHMLRINSHVHPSLPLHAELESACLSELNEDRLCIALLDRLLCVV